MPLCWGNSHDEQAVMDCFQTWTKEEKPRRKQKQPKSSVATLPKDRRQPDVIIIGDVAYQHYPGAPSHFDELLSTVLTFLGPHTIVIFGTRMR
mmetsp:Transcript_13686/g.24535  ORF Transcript_13686/g.24535 Transcript_13686/m.24535 type:complete len:93 (+) Transcript_13686:1-279(+)